jgi:hypothetical protein
MLPTCKMRRAKLPYKPSKVNAPMLSVDEHINMEDFKKTNPTVTKDSKKIQSTTKVLLT